MLLGDFCTRIGKDVQYFHKNRNFVCHFGIFLISGIFHVNMIPFFFIYFQRKWGVLLTVKNYYNIKKPCIGRFLKSQSNLAAKGLTIFTESTKESCFNTATF